MNQQHASNATDRTWQRPALRRLSRVGESSAGSYRDSSEVVRTYDGRDYFYYPGS